jgi:hypothetical protein
MILQKKAGIKSKKLKYYLKNTCLLIFLLFNDTYLFKAVRMHI